jgi:hypothetical protein
MCAPMLAASISASSSPAQERVTEGVCRYPAGSMVTKLWAAFQKVVRLPVDEGTETKIATLSKKSLQSVWKTSFPSSRISVKSRMSDFLGHHFGDTTLTAFCAQLKFLSSSVFTPCSCICGAKFVPRKYICAVYLELHFHSPTCVVRLCEGNRQ